ncbi:hypothetical protein [Mycolicibacterium palauense]|uniref:hypothetical protein n=1 Tax=Mycolicibacterium palauense TaxID=2034511 RepID=UPI000BFF12A4|nr:hypothetical protein [Mycolicibacterium palauense]
MEGCYTTCGPVAGSAVVEAWADAYIRYGKQRRPAWQEHLRAEIKARCARLEPSSEQVLHAKFFGDKRADTDVENLLIFGIDSFRTAGRNGIRFELAAAAPPAPDGIEFPFCYRYALAPRSGNFDTWRYGRTMASFGWTDLGALRGEKLAASVWLALRRREVEIRGPADEPNTAFAVKLRVRPPPTHRRVLGNLMKPFFDGVIAAFQIHSGSVVRPEVTARLADQLEAHPDELSEYLQDDSRAVLGAAPRLVALYRSGVQWNPTDHLCVAGELLRVDPVDSGWAISGEIVQVFR